MNPEDHPFNQPGRKPLNEFNRVAVVLDSYKIKRFRQVLGEKGFHTKLKKGVTPDSATLIIDRVHIDKLEDLKKILERLQHEFAHRN